MAHISLSIYGSDPERYFTASDEVALMLRQLLVPFFRTHVARAGSEKFDVPVVAVTGL